MSFIAYHKKDRQNIYIIDAYKWEVCAQKKNQLISGEKIVFLYFYISA